MCDSDPASPMRMFFALPKNLNYCFLPFLNTAAPSSKMGADLLLLGSRDEEGHQLSAGACALYGAHLRARGRACTRDCVMILEDP